jgi:hypothetical protein
MLEGRLRRHDRARRTQRTLDVLVPALSALNIAHEVRYTFIVSRFAFTAAIVCAAPAFADTAYFAAIEDLPMPTGFVESPGWTMPTEAGALTEVRAAGAGSVDETRAFYERSLPPLGWSASPQVDGGLVFLRGRERLMFAFSAPGAGRVFMRARLLMHAAPSNAD